MDGLTQAQTALKPMTKANINMPKQVRFSMHDVLRVEYPEDIRIPISQQNATLSKADNSENQLIIAWSQEPIVASTLPTAVVKSPFIMASATLMHTLDDPATQIMVLNECSQLQVLTYISQSRRAAVPRNRSLRLCSKLPFPQCHLLPNDFFHSKCFVTWPMKV